MAEVIANNNEDEDPDVAEMERLMALQEQEHEEQHLDEDTIQDGEDQDQFRNNDDAEDPMDLNDINHRGFRVPSKSLIKMHYTPVSFVAAVFHIIYVLRTRKQGYLALLYLTSSKLSYVLLGNAVLASFYRLFQFTIHKFLNGLRLMEQETIVDHIRWNVTETCIALTMFRQEISVKTMGIFLVIIFGKCLHWATELRVNHLRMTEEVFYFLSDNEFTFGDSDLDTSSGNDKGKETPIWWVWRAVGIFMPKSVKNTAFQMHQGLPRVRLNHFKIAMLLSILYIFDVLSLAYCASHLLESGPSIYIMFIFESAILVASVMSSSTLYGIHVFDGCLTVLQRLIIDEKGHEDENGSTTEEDRDQREEDPESPEGRGRETARSSLPKYMLQHVATVWRDQRITATFMVELMALASKFLFHLILFVCIFTLYGLPINIIRDFYMAFNKLKQRLVAFSSYHRLTSNMNSRFESVTSEEELEAAGGTCIICRDRMDVQGIYGDCKKLPVCGHTFHKHCLREWLVQQQTCPTCRRDIQVNEARAKAMAREAQEQEQAAIPPTGQGEDTTGAGRATNEIAEVDNQTAKDSVTSFVNPVLCKIIVRHGASVYEVDDSTRCRKRIRMIDTGKIVVCTASSTFQCHESGEDGAMFDLPRIHNFLKTPDGWILSSDMMKIVELKPGSK